MSHLLWKHFWENDVDKFRRLLAPSGQSSQTAARNSYTGNDSLYLGKSPGAPGTSPRPANKARRASGYTPGGGSKGRDAIGILGRHDINSRDHAGLTLLLRASSSVEPNAHEFAEALIEHPSIDIYVQDPESGWNALHRALYSGNVTIARALLKKEREYLDSHDLSSVNKVGMLIKTKDHEGNSPFDVYNSTIATRSLQPLQEKFNADDASESAISIGDHADTYV
jgi:inhibitor of Bruton tyrosine kinase